MVEPQRSMTTTAEPSPDEPLLRQGRPADPPAEKRLAEQASVAADASSDPSGMLLPEDEAGEKPAVIETEKTVAESRQRKLRMSLRQCDRVMLMDFNILAMSDWPDNYAVALARRSRDLWLFCVFLSAIVFFSGMTGFVPAWIAGGSFGVFGILLLLGVPAVRGLYTSKPSHLELIAKRRQLLGDARKHIQHLEGSEGLVWQCAQMAEYNTNLKAMRFSELVSLSERRVLTKNLSRREHIRLYLVYLLEAEKAYSRAQHNFFEGHQQAIDKGWESVATSVRREA